jgi:Zn-dependent oligopeptidase
MESVLTGLFKLCHAMFGITITERTGKVETWHPDVR